MSFHLIQPYGVSIAEPINVNWMQESGEFKALSYQAFNFARIVFDNAAAPNRQKKAVVVDLDETMLDNSAYAAWRIKNNIPFKQADWAR